MIGARAKPSLQHGPQDGQRGRADEHPREAPGRQTADRRARLIRTIKAAPDESAALAAIRREIEPGLEAVTRDDFMGAITVFLLVVATALPAAVPFLLVDDPWLALRLSNLLLIASLFIVGYSWALHTNASPWLTGLGVMIIGVLLVAIAIPLGG